MFTHPDTIAPVNTKTEDNKLVDNVNEMVFRKKHPLKTQLNELIKDDDLNNILNKTCYIRRLRYNLFLMEEKYSLYEYLLKLIDDDSSGIERHKQSLPV